MIQEVLLSKDAHGQKIPLLTRLIEKHFLFDSSHTLLFLEHTFYNDLQKDFAVDEWEAREEVQNMGCWPAKDSVQVIDKTVVIKLSN